ncbi:hypothetical protein A5636_12840 [Mycobacterium asiaticum]|uniref:PknH-like extracellular domain-containing protein n=2 Tax=Mycobacterium asiaticum TaxID=1790 RepID=A0A1A3MUT1_MYCAS|nr:hypothetical protein A5636_12840 [Mycobacterium asiaticum]
MPAAPPTRKRWPIVAALAGVLAVLAGTGIWFAIDKGGDNQASGAESTTATASTTTAVTTTTTSLAPTFNAAQLDSLLLSPEEIGAIVGATGMVADPKITEMKDPGTGNTLSDERCLGALIGYQTRTYKSSGYTGMLAQLVQRPHVNPGWVVVQGGVVFASAEQATGFVTGQQNQWQQCAGRTITQVNAGKSIDWAFREVTGNPPRISLQRDPVSGITGVACQHVLNAVSNVVIDVNVCAPGTTDQAGQIADNMAAKLPR